jgi:hypothetical protein
MATRLTRTTTTPTLSTKCTFSAWIKRTDTAINVSSRDAVLCENYIDGNNYAWIRLDGSDKLNVYGVVSGSAFVSISTSAKFKDTNAWYHVVCVLDSTESTSTDRLKIYVNGERQTALSGSTYPGSSDNIGFNRASGTFILGDSLKYTSNFQFDGCMSHVHFVDGAAYQASTFGSTDSTTGEWKILTAPTITEYGANGFFMFKDDASLSDDSGKGNNFTVAAGSIQKTEDNPSNVFCTLNRMNTYSGTLSNGNLKISQSSYDYNTQGTLGMVSGKWYWEVKMGGLHAEIGIAENSKAGQSDPQTAAGFRMIYSNGSGGVVVYNNATGGSSTTNSGWTNFASGQIIGVAYDADNGKLYFHNNGTYYNSGDPAGGTGAVISSISPQYAGVMVPFLGSGTSNSRTHEINFGNGYFGTTAISSEGNNASGFGKFEYDVPTGYTALCTKGLNE